jgi:hypothetical protein
MDSSFIKLYHCWSFSDYEFFFASIKVLLCERYDDYKFKITVACCNYHFHVSMVTIHTSPGFSSSKALESNGLNISSFKQRFSNVVISLTIVDTNLKEQFQTLTFSFTPKFMVRLGTNFR